MKNKIQLMGLLIIILVISMPLVSAATVRITSNHGTLGVEGYINAEEDTWTIEAAITGAVQTVLPENVKLRANAELNFNTCETNSALGTICSFETTLSGVSEQRHDFIVEYLSEPGTPASGKVFADGSGPVIDINEIKQEESALRVNFVVTENKDSDSGIKTITITDENNLELSAVEITDKKKREYNEKIPLTSVLEATKTITIKAVDMLGHEESESKEIKVDLVTPVISSVVNLTSLNDFIGNVARTTDLKVDVTENSDVNRNGVTAVSSQIEFSNNKAECRRDGQVIDLWHCTWRNILVKPFADISIKVTAKDAFGNEATADLSKTLTLDASAPEIVFFGTEKRFNEKSYLNKGANWLVLEINEIGSGIIKENILATLADFGQGNRVIPSDCNTEGTLTTCYWSVNVEGGTRASPSITEYQDNSGNSGLTTGADLIIDTAPPKVEEVSVYGVGDGREKDSFMSHDQLKIDFKVVEQIGGVNILVNLNNVVMDAATIFPANERRGIPAGWQVFTHEQASCQLEGEGSNTWLCSILTPEIKSGPDNSVDLEIDVQDTAGNSAVEWSEEARNVQGSSGDYSFELLGDTTEERPNYWELDGRITYAGFINLDASKEVFPRVSANIPLKSESAVALEVDVANCDIEELYDLRGIELSRNLLYAGNTEGSEINPSLVLEFAPFDPAVVFAPELEADENFNGTDIKMNCQLRIYSQLGDLAIRNAEVQEINLSVPFRFSKLGGLDENLDKKIKDARDSAFTNFAVTFADIQNGIEEITFWNNVILRPVAYVLRAISGIQMAIEAPSRFPGLYSAMTGVCLKGGSMQGGLQDVIKIIEIPGAILSCSPTTGWEWYDNWQSGILDQYNYIASARYFEDLGSAGASISETGQIITLMSGRDPNRARNLRDNLFVASAGLCLPGIIENLEKIGQIQCRYVYCLEKEVAQGIPVSICDDSRGEMWCKYVFDEMIGFIPIFSPLELFFNSLKTAVQDPIGTALSFGWNLCTLKCPASPGLAGACSATYVVTSLFQQVTGIFDSIESRDNIDRDYCSLIED